MLRQSIIAIGCAAALCPLAAKADFVDYDSFFNATPVTSTTPLSSQFDFTLPGDGDGLDTLGYNPLTQVVTGVSLSVQVLDGNVQQTVKLTLDNVVLTTFFTSSLQFGGTLSPVDEAALIAAAQDGKVNYKFETPDAQGNYTPNFAQLTITTAPRTAGVPDAGSTGALLAFALGGFGLISRRFRR